MGAGVIKWMWLTKGFINSAYRTPARSSVLSVERLKTMKLLSSWGPDASAVKGLESSWDAILKSRKG